MRIVSGVGRRLWVADRGAIGGFSEDSLGPESPDLLPSVRGRQQSARRQRCRETIGGRTDDFRCTAASDSMEQTPSGGSTAGPEYFRSLDCRRL
jgi:hypothetical protein